MTPGPAAKALHEYFPTYQQFASALPAGRLFPRETDRAASGTANKIYGKRQTHAPAEDVSMWVIACCCLFSIPFLKGLIGWEMRRGTGKVNPALDQHYYWGIRYHFFLGYREYVRSAENGQARDAIPKDRESENP